MRGFSFQASATTSVRAWLARGAAVVAGVLAAAFPAVTFAQLQEGVEAASAPLFSFGGCSGGSCVVPTVELLIIGFRALLATWAMYNIVRVGFEMITSRDEGQLDKAKTTIAAIAAGLILAVLPIEKIVTGFLYLATDAETAAINPSNEVYGILRWSLVMIAVVAVTVIIINGVRAVLKYDSDEGVALMRRTVMSVAAGILLIIFTEAIKAALGVPDFGDLGLARPGSIAISIVEVIVKLLFFAALIAVLVIIYAGIVMIAYFGNEEKFTYAKNLIIRVVVGLIVIAVSYLIIRFVVSAALCGGSGC
jgi:hypothetical protein